MITKLSWHYIVYKDFKLDAEGQSLSKSATPRSIQRKS